MIAVIAVDNFLSRGRGDGDEIGVGVGVADRSGDTSDGLYFADDPPLRVVGPAHGVIRIGSSGEAPLTIGPGIVGVVPCHVCP